MQLASNILLDGDLAPAIRWLDEAVPIFRRLKHEGSISVALNLLGWARLAQADPAGASALFEEAHAIAQRRSNLPVVGWSARNLGLAYLKTGDFGRAAQSLRDSLRIYRQIGYISGAIMSFELLAALEAEQGRPVAVRWLAVAEELRRQSGQPRPVFDEQMYYGRALMLAQQTLCPAEFAVAWQEGAALPLEEAFALALAG
jgi:tetratricopeptide (TPR) repeat protein